MDELSTGISVQPYNVLIQSELLHFLYSTRKAPADVYPVKYFAWTYAANIFGHMSPQFKLLDDDTNKAIQKSWFAFMSTIKFSDYLKTWNMSPETVPKPPSDYYDRQNRDCELHRDDFQTFDQAFLIELKGALDFDKAFLNDAIIYFAQKQFGVDEETIRAEIKNTGGNTLAPVIYEAFRLKKLTTQLSCFRIPVGIHAAIRHSRQKHKPGDQHDHLHARSALPFCDLFLTEKNLCHLLCAPPLEYDKLYYCRVVWKPEDAIKALDEVIRE